MYILSPLEFYCCLSQAKGSFYRAVHAVLGKVASVASETVIIELFNARCTLVQSAVLRSHVVCLSVCLSVCNVGGLWSHRLEFFENNFTSPGCSLFATPTWRICSTYRYNPGMKRNPITYVSFVPGGVGCAASLLCRHINVIKNSCTEVVHVPKWSKFRISRKTCTEVVCTEMVMYRTGPKTIFCLRRNWSFFVFCDFPR